MKQNFDESLKFVLKYEGGYSNHPSDPGGPTNLGVTLGEAKRLGLDIDHDGDVDVTDIKLLKPADAGKVFKNGYWDVCQCDQLPSGLDVVVFDYAVNSGPAKAGKDLQRVLGGLTVDGVIGRNTLNAATQVDVIATINALCDQRLMFLKGLNTWPIFGKGWGARVDALRALALTMVLDAPVSSPTNSTTEQGNWFTNVVYWFVSLLRSS